MLMAMLLAGSDVVEDRAEVLIWYGSYVACMENKAVVVGAFNKKPPSVAVDIASRQCASELKQFFISFYDSEPHSQRHDDQFRDFVGDAEGRATEAVIASRTGSCGTALGRLRCR